MSLARPSQFVKALRRRLGKGQVLSNASELVAYECDGFTIEKSVPDAVVFPESTREVADVVKLANEYEMPVVARGAGTSLAGGCLPIGGGVVVMLTRMKKIVNVDLRNRMAVWWRRAYPISNSREPSAAPAIILPPILPAKAPARSAATWPPTRADRTR